MDQILLIIILIIVVTQIFVNKKRENMETEIKFEKELPSGYKTCGLRCAGRDNIYYGNPNVGLVKIGGLKKNIKYSCNFNSDKKSNAYRAPFIETNGLPIPIDIKEIKKEFIKNTGKFDRAGLSCYNEHDHFYTPYSHNYYP
jgi:hypothetical protein